jgi:RHS repeat-associated protein
VSYLHLDHLGTPKRATNSAGTTIWRAENDAFYTTLPNEDPDQDGTLTTVNLRFPGQYYDQETGLHYNWNRYYDPRTGRYIASDPIGLKGGLNSYAYVDNNPLRWIDPLGLAKDSITASIESAIIRGDTRALQNLIQSGGLSPAQEAAAQAGIRSIEVLGRTTNSTARLAELIGRRQKEI